MYVDGSFDLLHPGHLRLLEKARALGQFFLKGNYLVQNIGSIDKPFYLHLLGDFLYVGLHSDEDIAKHTGGRFPIMQWNERLMSLLACKYVSEVVMDAPSVITESLLDAFQINCVVQGIDDYSTTEDTENEEMGNQRVYNEYLNVNHTSKFSFDFKYFNCNNVIGSRI